jgi:hypothetical protein
VVVEGPAATIVATGLEPPAPGARPARFHGTRGSCEEVSEMQTTSRSRVFCRGLSSVAATVADEMATPRGATPGRDGR